MEHIVEAQMVGNIWDDLALTPGEQDHLVVCKECQAHFRSLERLHDDLEVARRSVVRPEAEERYVALFAATRQAARAEDLGQKVLANLTEWVLALPIWDSRERALAAGIRNASASSYRVLYGTGSTEIELMVEAQNGQLAVVGELMSDTQDGKSGFALVELVGRENPAITQETESDGFGRFRLEHVPPGLYTLVITPRHSQVMVIKPLELT